MTSLHTLQTDKGITLSETEDGPALFTINYLRTTNRNMVSYGAPWGLTQANTTSVRWFKTLEGAEFYALHLHAEG